MITKYLEGIVKRFYDNQLKIPEIALLIGDAETFRRLENSMHRYILDLFDGHYNDEYVNRRLRIGKVHQRIGGFFKALSCSNLSTTKNHK